MSISVTPSLENPKVSVVHMPGTLDITLTDVILPQLTAALGQSEAGMILDFGETRLMSSAGLRALIVVRKKAMDMAKPIALIRVRPLVYKIFEISELYRAFHFFDKQGDAIRALWPQA